MSHRDKPSTPLLRRPCIEGRQDQVTSGAGSRSNLVQIHCLKYRLVQYSEVELPARRTPAQGDGIERKTAVVSVRLPQSIVSKLQKEASSRGIGLGDLTRELLSNHVVWGMYAARVPILPIPPTLLVRMLDHFTETEITQIARESGKVVLSQLGDVVGGGQGLETLLRLLKAWLENSHMTVTYTAGDQFSCLVVHNMGRKWSLYLGNLVESALREGPIRRSFKYTAKEKSLSFAVTLRHQF